MFLAKCDKKNKIWKQKMKIKSVDRKKSNRKNCQIFYFIYQQRCEENLIRTRRDFMWGNFKKWKIQNRFLNLHVSFFIEQKKKLEKALADARYK